MIELNDNDILELSFKLGFTLCSNHAGNINNIFGLGKTEKISEVTSLVLLNIPGRK